MWQKKTALSQSFAFTSNEFHSDGKRWRMLLFVKPPICKMYVQMRSALSPVRVAIRYFYNNYRILARSCASSELQVIARKCDWFIALSAPVVIGRSNCFGFGFSTVI